MSQHARYLSRTVMCSMPKQTTSAYELPPHEKAFKLLTSKLNNERILEITKRNRYYEKQWMKRRRLAYEECTLIQRRELQKKINFLIRENRKEPWRI